MPDPKVGRVVTAADVDAAVIDTLSVWMPAYVAELSEQSGVDIPSPVAVVSRQAPEYRKTDRYPFLIVADSGAEFTVRSEEADAVWSVSVYAMVNEKTERGVRDLAARLIAAVRVCLMQKHPGVTVTGEAYGVGDFDDEMVVGAGELTFDVSVPGAVVLNPGPDQPDGTSAPIPVVEAHFETATVEEP